MAHERAAQPDDAVCAAPAVAAKRCDFCGATFPDPDPEVGAVHLELHQLNLRYERLRKRSPREERALLVSLSEIGQQLPVVVIEETPSSS